ncbi:MAG: putative membrane protein [Salibacteraceae bacterium]|jgi:putative membrane protein
MILARRIEISKLYAFTKKNMWFLVATCIITFFCTKYFGPEKLQQLTYPTGVVGTALAFLIGFRNNSAYDRWWEARKIWGKLVNDSRYFALKVIGLISRQWNSKLTKEDIISAQKRLIYRHIAFVWAVNKHLRKSEWKETIAPFISKEKFTNYNKNNTFH